MQRTLQGVIDLLSTPLTVQRFLRNLKKNVFMQNNTWHASNGQQCLVLLKAAHTHTHTPRFRTCTPYPPRAPLNCRIHPRLNRD